MSDRVSATRAAEVIAGAIEPMHLHSARHDSLPPRHVRLIAEQLVEALSNAGLLVVDRDELRAAARDAGRQVPEALAGHGYVVVEEQDVLTPEEASAVLVVLSETRIVVTATGTPVVYEALEAAKAKLRLSGGQHGE